MPGPFGPYFEWLSTTTWRKSLNHYWLLDGPVFAENWRPAERRRDWIRRAVT